MTVNALDTLKGNAGVRLLAPLRSGVVGGHMLEKSSRIWLSKMYFNTMDYVEVKATTGSINRHTITVGKLRFGCCFEV